MANEEAKIFFSYARHEDGEFALKLAQDLRAAGVNIWMDQLDIPAGVRWDRAIERALKACRGLLVILSPASVENNNVMDEVSYALEEGKQVLPVLYRKCTPPFRLRRLQYSDFTTDYEKGLTRLLRALDKAPAASTKKQHERSWISALVANASVKKRSIWISVLLVLAVAGIMLIAYALNSGEPPQETNRSSAHSTDTLLTATEGNVLSEDGEPGTSPLAQTNQPEEETNGLPSTEKTSVPSESPSETKKGATTTAEDPTADETHTDGGEPPQRTTPSEEPAGEVETPIQAPVEGDERAVTKEVTAGEAANGEVAEEEESDPLDAVLEEARNLQTRLEKAVMEKDWTDVPPALTSYYKKQIDKLRKADIKSADVVLEPLTLDSDGAAATMPVSLYISYVQKGREGEKAVPIHSRWTWERIGDQLTLVSVQGS